MTKPDDIAEISFRVSRLCEHVIELEKGMLKLHQDFSLLCEPTVNMANGVLELQKMLVALGNEREVTYTTKAGKSRGKLIPLPPEMIAKWNEEAAAARKAEFALNSDRLQGGLDGQERTEVFNLR